MIRPILFLVIAIALLSCGDDKPVQPPTEYPIKIIKINPEPVYPGIKMTISGEDFGDEYDSLKCRVLFNEKVMGVITNWKADTIEMIAPNLKGKVLVQVKNGDLSSNEYTVFYYDGIIITSIEDQCYTGVEISLSGLNFGDNSKSSKIIISEKKEIELGKVLDKARIKYWSDTLISFLPPEEAGFRYAWVSVNNETSNFAQFKVLDLPKITSIAPAELIEGISFKLAGQNLDNRPFEILFNGTPAENASIYDIYSGIAYGIVPGKINSGTVVYKSGNVTSNELKYTFINKAEIYSIEPSVLTAGEKAVIKGKDFSNEQGKRCLYLNGEMMEIIAWSEDRIEFNIPKGIVNGSLCIKYKSDGKIYSISNTIDFKTIFKPDIKMLDEFRYIEYNGVKRLLIRKDMLFYYRINPGDGQGCYYPVYTAILLNPVTFDIDTFRAESSTVLPGSNLCPIVYWDHKSIIGVNVKMIYIDENKCEFLLLPDEFRNILESFQKSYYCYQYSGGKKNEGSYEGPVDLNSIAYIKFTLSKK